MKTTLHLILSTIIVACSSCENHGASEQPKDSPSVEDKVETRREIQVVINYVKARESLSLDLGSAKIINVTPEYVDVSLDNLNAASQEKYPNGQVFKVIRKTLEVIPYGAD